MGKTGALPAQLTAPHRKLQRKEASLGALCFGVEAGDHVPSRLDDEKAAWADVVVAVCDDACPVIPDKRYVGWQFPDPWGRPPDEVRKIRDDIAVSVGELVRELDNDPHEGG